MTAFTPQHVKVLAERLLSPAAEDEDLVLPDGGIAHIRRRPFQGVRATAELVAGDQTQVFTLYEPVQERPPGYPDSLPHVPNVPVLVAALKEGLMAVWQPEEEASRVQRAVFDQLAHEGWVPTGQPTTLPGALEVVTLQRGGSNASLSRVLQSVILMFNPT